MAKKKILIVDDDPIIQRMFGGWLSKADYHVVYAHDSNNGREMARRYKPDLILMDIRMPGNEDGVQTAMRLRNEDETKGIPISLLSSEDLSIEAEKLLKEKKIGYIHKGIEMEDFYTKVKLLLE